MEEVLGAKQYNEHTFESVEGRVVMVVVIVALVVGE